MARYENRFPDAGVTCTQGVDNFVQTIAAPSGRPQWVDEVEISTRSTTAGDLPMLVKVIEYTTDGSTGTTNNSVALDPDVSATPPAGKHTEAGSGAQIPGGTAREIWRGEIQPQYPRTINLVDIIAAAGRKVIGGRFFSVVVKPNTVNQTVFCTVRHSD